MAQIKAIYRNKTIVPEDPDIDFTGKTIIVTGSNTGLGLEAAAKFSKSNCRRLILAVRDSTKGATAQRVIQHLASDPACKVEAWRLDMADYDSIRAFSKRVDDELDCVDIALLNAGVYMSEYTKSVYGWEQSLQVNVLGTAYLALLLLPKLRHSNTGISVPVLEFTASALHAAVKPTDDEWDANTNTFEAFNGPAAFSGGKLYRTSKLFLQFTAREIARLARPDTAREPVVLVTTVDPGSCQSQLSRGVNGPVINLAKLVANTVFLRTTEEGARTLVSGTGIGVAGHGEFWRDDAIQKQAAILQSVEGQHMQEKAWGEILDAIAKDVPDIKDHVKSL